MPALGISLMNGGCAILRLPGPRSLLRLAMLGPCTCLDALGCENSVHAETSQELLLCSFLAVSLAQTGSALTSTPTCVHAMTRKT